MFQIPSVVRRPLAVAGAAFIGLAAAVVLGGSPASAHHSNIDVKYECVEGSWKVDWTVSNSEKDLDGTITDATFSPEFASESIKKGAALPKDDGEAAKLTATQTVPHGTEKVSLSVSAEWFRGDQHITNTEAKEIKLPKRGCGIAEPSAGFVDDCVGGVTVTLKNGEKATKSVRLTVVANDFTETVTLAPGKTSEPIEIPAGVGEIKVLNKEEVIDSHSYETPEACLPELRVENTCDLIKFEIVNPEIAPAFEALFTPSTGEPKKVPVASGATVPVEFAASEGLTVVISVDGEDSPPIPWEKPEEGCGGGGGGELPRTGAPASLVAGGAAGVLAIGAALFVVARRRKLRFTA